MESAPLDVNTGAVALAALLGGEEAKEPEAVEEEAQPEQEAQDTEAEQTDDAPEGEEDSADDEETVTIEVDGKPVTMTKAELAEAYKSGLRQSDYTRKTMEAAETRRAADAEIQKAREERATFAQKLQQQEAVLNASLQEQSQINWNQLLEADPVEYLKQQHLFQQRQAALQQTQQEQQALYQQAQAEQQANVQKFLQEQQDQLLAKLPEWKDEGKAKAEKQAIREFLKSSGYSDDEISQAADHRMIVIAREAMKFRDTMAKAKAAAKKVENLPKKVVSSGSGTSPSVDKRGSAFQRLSKSGSVEDAAAVFASIL